MKTVQDIMTVDPICCSPDTPLQDVARMMVEHDCGCIPVVETHSARVPLGVVTDRDIASRAVAEGRDALTLSARDVMSEPAISVLRTASIDECCRVMADKMLRRVVIVDADGNCCGIVAQADVALNTAKQKTGDVVRQVSQPMAEADPLAAAEELVEQDQTGL